MTFRKTLLRTVLAGLLLSSTTALAAPSDFSTDISLTMAFVTKTGETAGLNDDTVALNGTRQVKTTLSVPVGTVATGITLTADALPAGPEFVITGVTNCVKVDPAQTGPFPCKVADLADGHSVSVVTTFKQNLTDPMPATCNFTPAAYGPFTLTVSTTSTDPDTANNTGTVTPVPLPWVFADVAVNYTGAAEATPNANATYHVTVTNNGPCDTDVFVFSDALPGPVFVSATWACSNSPPDDPEVDGCDLGVIASGGVVEFDKVYYIPGMASDAVQYFHYLGASVEGDVLDPNGDNNAKDPLVMVSQSVSGCSTSGAGGPTGLLAVGAVLALAFRRRRAA